ncbi:Acyl-CoA N-acyltransferases (NAT) superfamily protein [Rhynchospora pubera]|uniref:Acyl-CoA N-acyltransferases (NAT) superfamily protein n=1 Tax=Rhynchospora pubera TaxID=906938 RepID=A0AAV8HGQ7_9POAL|nr:Acyl-CoA N-acyltransferases (NAT) superfamily protein [Rhynchospora pubera]KAJ4815845.1 Acyl-CoA N-acyltransferases (NAT) superfamily protein [Rhynchospora pubera]
MALLSSPDPQFLLHLSKRKFPNPKLLLRNPNLRVSCSSGQLRLATKEAVTIDSSQLRIKEFLTDSELHAAVRLRIRTFYEFRESYGVEELRRSLTEREYEGLNDRISGKLVAFKRVACINATLPISGSLISAEGLCSECKFIEDGKERVVVGTLDLNQCLWLPDELTGRRPEVSGSNLMRAYISNVCVAKELQRNGLGFKLINKSKDLARVWGITDLYVHVAIDNEGAQKLYEKCGFVYESEEPAWKARFLGRTRRFLLWTDLKN